MNNYFQFLKVRSNEMKEINEGRIFLDKIFERLTD